MELKINNHIINIRRHAKSEYSVEIDGCTNGCLNKVTALLHIRLKILEWRETEQLPDPWDGCISVTNEWSVLVRKESGKAEREIDKRLRRIMREIPVEDYFSEKEGISVVSCE